MFKLSGVLFAGLLMSQAAWAGATPIRVGTDSAVTIDLKSPAETVLVVNTAIADVSPINGTRLAILGKSAGQTSLLAFDAEGNRLIEATILVSPAPEWTVKLNKGVEESVLTCSPNCTAPSTSAPAGGGLGEVP